MYIRFSILKRVHRKTRLNKRDRWEGEDWEPLVCTVKLPVLYWGLGLGFEIRLYDRV